MNLKQKRVLVKHTTGVYTEAQYFALNVGVNSTDKGRNGMILCMVG